jgi:threonine aldolase
VAPGARGGILCHFGGGLSSVWPFAMVAQHYLNGFGDCYSQAVKTSEEWIRGLAKQDRFTITRVPLENNLLRLQVRGTDAAALQKRLAARGVIDSAPQKHTFLIGINETINRTTAAALTGAFTG